MSHARDVAEVVTRALVDQPDAVRVTEGEHRGVAVIEVFVRLHQQRARLRPDTNLSAWLFTTLTNFCHNQYRWRRRHPVAALDEAGQAEEGAP
ncbi:MAG: hypothetical protein NTY02_10015, partial [Acidobacteria bacterium]|nr:hypothetical protein [Acidobacteriota bacterium]